MSTFMRGYWMRTNRSALTVILIALAFVVPMDNVNAQAPLECIEKADKPLACEHVIIKIADPRIVRSSRIEGSPVCICLSDFPSIYAESQSAESPEITPEERLILDRWQLNIGELNQLLRF